MNIDFIDWLDFNDQKVGWPWIQFLCCSYRYKYHFIMVDTHTESRFTKIYCRYSSSSPPVASDLLKRFSWYHVESLFLFLLTKKQIIITTVGYHSPCLVIIQKATNFPTLQTTAMFLSCWSFFRVSSLI